MKAPKLMWAQTNLLWGTQKLDPKYRNYPSWKSRRTPPPPPPPSPNSSEESICFEPTKGEESPKSCSPSLAVHFLYKNTIKKSSTSHHLNSVNVEDEAPPPANSAIGGSLNDQHTRLPNDAPSTSTAAAASSSSSIATAAPLLRPRPSTRWAAAAWWTSLEEEFQVQLALAISAPPRRILMRGGSGVGPDWRREADEFGVFAQCCGR
ncbi:hypothetical protein Scep_007738 [Stephania cephalantha]|uniref:Uncharacterized protein n=1 Tax=Stephania cephalantha TaxID=152367 RepID=A0AAP0KAG4_9MAGN